MNVAALDARLERCRSATRELRASKSETRNHVLRKAERQLGERLDFVLEANARDLAALAASATPAFRDRLLRLTEVALHRDPGDTLSIVMRGAALAARPGPAGPAPTEPRPAQPAPSRLRINP